MKHPVSSKPATKGAIAPVHSQNGVQDHGLNQDKRVLFPFQHLRTMFSQFRNCVTRIDRIRINLRKSPIICILFTVALTPKRPDVWGAFDGGLYNV